MNTDASFLIKNFKSGIGDGEFQRDQRAIAQKSKNRLNRTRKMKRMRGLDVNFKKKYLDDLISKYIAENNYETLCEILTLDHRSGFLVDLKLSFFEYLFKNILNKKTILDCVLSLTFGCMHEELIHKLMHLGIIKKLSIILKGNNLPTNILNLTISIIGNLMDETAEIRDSIVCSGILYDVFNHIDDISDKKLSEFIYCMFIRAPTPNDDVINLVWPKIVDLVDGIKLEDDIEIIEDVLCAIDCICRNKMFYT